MGTLAQKALSDARAFGHGVLVPRKARLDASGTLHQVGRGIERRTILLGKPDWEDLLRRFEAVSGGDRLDLLA